jgi:hypothetical protein
VRNGFLPSVAALLIGCGVLTAQAPQTPPPSVPAPPSYGPPVALGEPSDGSSPGRVWVRGEYLLWWIKNGPVPPLVTAGPAGGAGVLGQPGTVTLFGPGSDLTGSPLSGGRFTAGAWLDEEQTFGLEGGYFFLGSNTRGFAAGGTGAPGSPVVARPFFNALAGREDSELVASPGVLGGVVGVASSSRLQGFEANALCKLCCGCTYRLDALAGFRYLDLRESLGITENLTVPPTVPLLGGTNFLLNDRFDVQNRFYGGQVGVRGEVWYGRLFAALAGKVALGDVHQSVDVNGTTRIASPTFGVTTQPGGLLALPSNSGHFTRDRFAVVPEGSLAVGVQATDNVRVSVGYTFLGWSAVARPGDQIDRAVNPSALPSSGGAAAATGPARPAFLFKDTDFWAQGLTLAIEFRF